VLGREVAVADSPRARLLGLAMLRVERAGAGLLIPRCRSVHTFGMRFALDVYFLDPRGDPIAVHRGVPPNRLLSDLEADAVLELPVGAELGAGGKTLRSQSLDGRNAAGERRDRERRRLRGR
jgi:hypothetical protein